MSETENSGDKTLTVAPSKTLHLKQRPTEQGGMVRQSFSHGRSKVVVVEKVKRRAPGHVETKTAAPPVVSPAPVAPPPPPSKPVQSAKPETRAPRNAVGVVLRALTEDEREARARALVDARGREEDDRRRAEADAKIRVEREAREKEERAAADARKREEEERLTREADFKRRSEEEARRRLAGEGPSPAPAPSAIRNATPRSADVAPASSDAKRPVVLPRRAAVVAPAPVPPRPTPSRGGVKDGDVSPLQRLLRVATRSGFVPTRPMFAATSA